MLTVRSSAVLIALSLTFVVGCGAPAAEPEPEVTQGAEVEPPPAPPPPPPAPATLRLVHASPDPAAATVSLAPAVGEAVVSDLAYRSGSPYVELAPGAQTLSLRGLASVETGEAPELASIPVELESTRSYTAILHGLPAGEPALAVLPLEDRTARPAEGMAALRFFHALVGVPSVDVCRPGATPREPAQPIAAAVAPGTLAASDAAGFVEVPAGAELAIQLRQQHATPCRGRVLGVARIIPTAGADHTLVAIGRTTGAPRADRELLVCLDGATESTCTALPIANR